MAEDKTRGSGELTVHGLQFGLRRRLSSQVKASQVARDGFGLSEAISR